MSAAVDTVCAEITLPKESTNVTVNSSALSIVNTGVYVTSARTVASIVASVETVVAPLTVQPTNLAPSTGVAVSVTLLPARTLLVTPAVASSPLRVTVPRSTASTLTVKPLRAGIIWCLLEITLLHTVHLTTSS